MSAELNPRCRFATFVVGPANQVACSAARSVGNALGTRYNPLCIVGPSGLGKSHLLMAIGHEITAARPEATVVYGSADEFAKEFHAAVAAGEGGSFRTRYESLDVLLLDDVQALAYQPEIQAELLRLIERLLGAGGQVVLSCDLRLAEFDTLEPQLVERLAGGLVVDVAFPEEETRLAILQRRAADRSTTFAEGVLEEAARADVRNVRELLALLHRLAAMQAMQDTALTLEEARAMVLGGPPAGVSPPEALEAPSPVPAERPSDEFSEFLADVSHALEEQVDHWREAVAKAVMKWESEGYRTVRLEQALDGTFAGPVEHLVSQYEADVRRLRRLQEAVREMAPDHADDPPFYDPDRTADAELLLKEIIAQERPLPAPSELWRPESFIESECSRAALSAVAAVVAEPGQRYNPLIVAGPPGVGKSHLLHSVAHGIVDQGIEVACMSAQLFADELDEAQAKEAEDRFRAWLGRAGAIVLDDVQVLVGRAAACDEFVYLFDRFLDRKRQLVLAINASPHEVEDIDERIVSRLDGGLLVSIDVPDRELCRQLIVHKIEERYGAAELDLVEYLSARPAASARAVSGLTQRVLNAAEARGELPSGALARDLIEGVTLTTQRPAPRVRVSGVVAAPTAPTNREKTVWTWPDLADRMIDEEIA